MKSVFIQSWTLSKKYLWSANLPLAMSQMTAMKMSRFLPKRICSTRNNDAFTHCGISLTSPNTLQQKYSSTLKSFMFFCLFVSWSVKQHPLWSTFQENDPYIKITFSINCCVVWWMRRSGDRQIWDPEFQLGMWGGGVGGRLWISS